MTRIRIEKGTGGWGGPLELDAVAGQKDRLYHRRHPPGDRRHRQPDRLAGGRRLQRGRTAGSEIGVAIIDCGGTLRCGSTRSAASRR
jgi:PTS system glucitol/sorbitol-specific IIC component